MELDRSGPGALPSRSVFCGRVLKRNTGGAGNPEVFWACPRFRECARPCISLQSETNMPKRTRANRHLPPDTDLRERLERALIAGGLSRRGFIQALTAAGLASAGVAVLADELDS